MRKSILLLIGLTIITNVSAIECPVVDSPWRINALQNIEKHLPIQSYNATWNTTITIANLGSYNLTGIRLTPLTLANGAIIFSYNDTNMTLPVNSIISVLVTINITDNAPYTGYFYGVINISDDTGNATDSIDVSLGLGMRGRLYRMRLSTDSNCTLNEVIITMLDKRNSNPIEGGIDVYLNGTKIANLIPNSTGQASFIPPVDGEYTIRGVHVRYTEDKEIVVNVSGCGRISVCKECCFTTIQEGINNASEGDTVVVTDMGAYQGVEITKNDITLDCQNATILSTIISSNANWVVIRNCTILTNGSVGIWINSGNDISIIGNRLTSNTLGIQINNPTRLIISDNVIFNNSAHGIRAYNLRDSVIQNNYISSNFYEGVSLSEGSNSIIINNTNLTHNRKAGVFFKSGNHTIVNSVSEDNGEYDIKLCRADIVTAINTTFNRSHVLVCPYDGDLLNVSWYLTTKILDSFNRYVQGVGVTIKDVSTAVVDGDLTNINGSSKQFLLTEYIQTKGSITNYTPHTIQISKWKAENSTIVYMNESKEILMYLDAYRSIHRYQMDVKLNGSFVNQTVTIKVFGKNGKPLGGSDVDVYFNSKKILNLESDKEGVAEFIPHQEGEYKIEIEKTRYVDEEITIDVHNPTVTTTTSIWTTTSTIEETTSASTTTTSIKNTTTSSLLTSIPPSTTTSIRQKTEQVGVDQKTTLKQLLFVSGAIILILLLILLLVLFGLAKKSRKSSRI